MKLIKFKNIRIKTDFLKLNQKNKNNLSIKMMDLGNIAFGTLLLSQLISATSFNLAIATLGVFLLISTYTFAIMLTK